VRFVLSRPVSRALVLGDLAEWRAGLAAAGIEVVDTTRTGTDLVVAAPQLADDPAALGAAALIVDGRTGRSVGSYASVQRFLVRPNRASPALLLPLDQPPAAAYGASHASVVDRRWKAVRRDVAADLLRRRRWPPVGALVTVAQRGAAPPALVGAARELGLPDDLGWFLALGQGDALSRNAFFLFAADAPEPEWVLKFARVAGYSDPFDRDEHGLRRAAAAAEVVAARAPRLVGRFVWNGIHASVETAARGPRLRELLTSSISHARKLRLVDEVAEWIVSAGAVTAEPPEALDAERRRLREQVVPHWRSVGATDDLVLRLPALPAVLQHNDLGSWNVLVGASGFTIVDWESSRSFGLPLWDLLYFLADALALVDGETDGETRHLHTRELFRGERPLSGRLFSWVGRAVSELGIPPDAVGPIATLCWLDHSLSPARRTGTLERLVPPAAARLHGTELNAETWLADEALGPRWDAWRRSRGD
jgi:hypothetical protein